MEMVRVYYVDAVAPGFRAMTIPPFGIFIRKDCVFNQTLLDHELRHWQQYLKMGLPVFYMEYLAQCVNYGYYNCSMEQDARVYSEQ